MKSIGEHKCIDEKRRIVAGYHGSGQSQREYAARVGIGLSTLGRWLRRSRMEDGVRLVEVEVPVKVKADGMVYRVSLSGGMVLEMGRGFEVTEVRMLFGMMKEGV